MDKHQFDQECLKNNLLILIHDHDEMTDGFFDTISLKLNFESNFNLEDITAETVNLVSTDVIFQKVLSIGYTCPCQFDDCSNIELINRLQKIFKEITPIMNIRSPGDIF